MYITSLGYAFYITSLGIRLFPTQRECGMLCVRDASFLIDYEVGFFFSFIFEGCISITSALLLSVYGLPEMSRFVYCKTHIRINILKLLISLVITLIFFFSCDNACIT